MTRRWRRARNVAIALAALAFVAELGTGMATATPTTCPTGTNCLPNPVIITDHAPGLAAPFLIEDNEGNPPGHNAPMAWVDGFQLGSVNPVCADTTVPFAAHAACLGGPPFNATGGHPVLALCLRMGPGDCAQWAVLTAGDVALLNAMRAAGITPRDLRVLAVWVHAREARR